MSPLFTCILLSTFFSYGFSLNCYSYVCSNSSVGPSPSCAPPQAITCVAMDGIAMAPDRCVTKRIVMEMSGITVHQEIRNCSYSYQCNMHDIFCNAANVTGFLKECEMGCCEGDLCNSGGPIPTQEPGPTGPSGADLTCLACSNIPAFGDQTDCRNPIRQTCGAGLSPFVPQDRCITIETTMRIPYVGLMKSKMKNCSNAAMCNQEMFCSAANSSGMIESCQLSCCFGNACNADSIPTTAPTAPAVKETSEATTEATETTNRNSSMSPSKPATTVYSKATVSMATGIISGLACVVVLITVA